ncbi:hypothetical protein LOD99_6482 [Oopsacas minuta]|uniref:Uncharacterized protein n=1 Tax=Oopsacas minuta TaxID=111878 RepID=A0AAV7JLL8_9METZ|nr:hypothetical protein LOD99_6482 [Oopsacas minuta]
MNNEPLEQILKPIIEYKQTNTKPLPPLYYDLLIDLCQSKEEYNSVLSEMIESKLVFSVTRLHVLNTKKLENILNFVMEKYDCIFPKALQILLGERYHSLFDSISDYINGNLEFKHLYLSFYGQTNILPVLQLLTKLGSFNSFANDFKNTLLHDNAAFNFVQTPQCIKPYRLFLLQQLISAYDCNDEELGFQKKILQSLDQIDFSNKIRSQKNQTQEGVHRTILSNPMVLADLYYVCLRKNNINLAMHAFSITHKYPLSGHYRHQRRYFVNLLHLQSLLRIRKKSTENNQALESQDSENIEDFLNHELFKQVNSLFFFPTPELFIANIHYQIANTLDPFDRNLFSKYVALAAIRKSSEIYEQLTSWTNYYTQNDRFPVNTYCNMLYIMVYFSHKLKTPLTFEQVSDLLERISPVQICLEGHRLQYLKAISYFDYYILQSYEGKQPPLKINNLILLSFSRVNAFAEMKLLYYRMRNDNNSVNMDTYNLLINSAIKQGLGKDCRFIFTELWPEIQESNQPLEIHSSILEGVIECICMCREHIQAISLLKKSFKEKRRLNLDIFEKFLSSCCKENDVPALEEFKDTILLAKDKQYNDIVERCSLKIEKLITNQQIH